MNPECPRRYKARYGTSMASEIHKNVTLQAGEEFLYSQFVCERKNLFMAQPRLLALTASFIPPGTQPIRSRLDFGGPSFCRHPCLS